MKEPESFLHRENIRLVCYVILAKPISYLFLMSFFVPNVLYAAQGDVLNVSVTPSSAIGIEHKSLSLSLVWNIEVEPKLKRPDDSKVPPLGLTKEKSDITVTVTSNTGVLVSQGRSASKGKLLRGSSTTGRVRISERITITQQEINNAIRLGAEQLFYKRTFSSENNSKTGIVTIKLKKEAKITGLTVSPNSADIVQGRPLLLRLIWSITTTSGADIAATEVISDQGILNIHGEAKEGVLRGSSSSGRISFSETLMITPNDVQRAISFSANQLTYRRTFNTVGSRRTAKVTIPIKVISPSSSGNLHSNHLSLTFNDGSMSKVLKQSSIIKAKAEISTTGTGSLSGRWEVAYQASGSSGKPLFTPLKQVQQARSISKINTLVSPILPTEQTGTYYVRFNLQRPKTKSIPTLRYYVRGSTNNQHYKIRLAGPASGISANTMHRFSWFTHPDSSNLKYQLQIFEKKSAFEKACKIQIDTSPLTGISLKNSKQTPITPIAAHKLKPGRKYCWQVKAFESGKLVAISESREFMWQGSK